MHEVPQAAYGGIQAAPALPSGPVMALESEIAFLTNVAEEAERISSNIAGNGPPRDIDRKPTNSPAPVLSVSQRIAGAAGQISALRDRISNAMSRIEQSL